MTQFQNSSKFGQKDCRALSACRSRFVALSIAFLLTMGLANSAFAQVLYGTLTGNVTDPAGAAIPNAHVTATEVQTSVVRNADTNEVGKYLFTNLLPGTYKVTVAAPGFQSTGQAGLVLQANGTVRADLQMAVGTASEQITVTTAPPELQTDTSDVSYNLSEQQMTELPTTSTTGRNFESLYRLVPGSTPPSEQNSAGANPQRSQAVNVNGITNETNTTRIDGAVDAYPWLPYLVAYLPPTDGIDSINVVTSSFNAEQGAAGGSAINVTIKSGTNTFHGSAWEYNSIKQFNALTWANRTHVNPKNIYNETGGTIGGPIKKDKLFFFFDYNRVSVIKGISGTLSVPTSDMRSGNFTSTGTTIYDPATGDSTGAGKTAFSGNIVPSSRISKAASILLTNLPTPNYGSAGALTNNYYGASSNVFTRSNYDTKITWVPNQTSTYFGHYSISPDTINDPQVFGSNPGGGTYDGGQPGKATGTIQNIGLGMTHMFTQRLSLDASAGYTRQKLLGEAPDISLGAYGLNTLGIPGTNYDGSSLYAGIPAMFFTTYAALGNSNTGSPFTFRDNQYTYAVNVSYVRGTHAFRAGGEYLDAQINHFQPGTGLNSTPRGSFIFSGGATALYGASTNNINSFADFLTGQADTYQQGVQTFKTEALRYATYSLYVQDTWQFSRKLTVNYGIRYEYYPLPWADHFGTVRYDPSISTSVTDSYGTHNVGTVLIGGKGSTPYHANTNNGWGQIVPRLGLSYRLDPKTVLRGGFGITTDPDTLRYLLQAYPAAVVTNVSGANSYVPASKLRSDDQSTTSAIGIATPPTVPSISGGTLPLAPSLSTNTLPKNFRRGYIYSYNVAVQRELPGHFVANLTYVGTRSVRQITNVNINASAPGAGSTTGRLLNIAYGANTSNADITSYQPFKGSLYNGLQTQLTRNATRFGSTGIIYTFSKAQDASDNGAMNGLIFAHPDYWNRNWALAGYDRTHNFQWWTVEPLPFGKGQSYLNHGIGAAIAGGWKLSTVLSRVSGTPMNVTASTGLLNAAGSSQVADYVAGATKVLNKNTKGYRQYLNPNAWTDVSTAAGVTTARFGNSGRNSVRGPGYFDLDASLKRTIQLRTKLSMDLAAESFDITNTPQFANPASAINSASTFGIITTSNANRTLRFSARLAF